MLKLNKYQNFRDGPKDKSISLCVVQLKMAHLVTSFMRNKKCTSRRMDLERVTNTLKYLWKFWASLILILKRFLVNGRISIIGRYLKNDIDPVEAIDAVLLLNP